MSRLYETLKELFNQREKIHINEVKNILNELTLPAQFLAKLRGNLIKIHNDVATKGYMLDQWDRMWTKIKNELTSEINMATWKDRASSHGILHELAGNGNEVVLTGRAPVWLYLKIAHALHGKVRRLIYNSPVTGDIVIFDHSPF